MCLCSAIVMNLAVSVLPPSSCQQHNISSRISKLSKRKTSASLENRRSILFALVFHRSEIIKYANRGVGKARTSWYTYSFSQGPNSLCTSWQQPKMSYICDFSWDNNSGVWFDVPIIFIPCCFWKKRNCRFCYCVTNRISYTNIRKLAVFERSGGFSFLFRLIFWKNWWCGCELLSESYAYKEKNTGATSKTKS